MPFHALCSYKNPIRRLPKLDCKFKQKKVHDTRLSRSYLMNNLKMHTNLELGTHICIYFELYLLRKCWKAGDRFFEKINVSSKHNAHPITHIFAITNIPPCTIHVLMLCIFTRFIAWITTFSHEGPLPN